MKKKIINYSKKLNIEYCGFTKLNEKTAIVFLFPYFCGYKENSNISVYTYGKDYHTVIKEYLEKICEFIKEEIKDFNYEIYTAVSPYNDIELAYNAGLGFIGKNRLLINEKYGSYVFIGYIITDTEIEHDEPVRSKCINCNKCASACPTKAITSGNFGMCLSSLTQKKGELTFQEKTLIKNNGYAFGCDICQIVCPLNKGNLTPFPEFCENLTTRIEKKDFEFLSNKEFKSKYKDKAFSWRGKNLIIRNLSLLEDEEENQQV